MNIKQMSNKFLLRIISENKEYIDFPEKEFVQDLNESGEIDNLIMAAEILKKKIRENNIALESDISKVSNYKLFNNENNNR